MIKLFIVRKYVYAESAMDAIKKEKFSPIDDVWMDDDWKKENLNKPEGNIGFSDKGRKRRKKK